MLKYQHNYAHTAFIHTKERKKKFLEIIASKKFKNTVFDYVSCVLDILPKPSARVRSEGPASIQELGGVADSLCSFPLSCCTLSKKANF